VFNPILIIIGINVIIFIAIQVSPGLVGTLGLYSDFQSFLQHPWGIVTSMFVHAEFFHILANMITLYFFGNLVLRLGGDKWFWIVYLGGGVLGGIFFIGFESLLNPGLSQVAIGASGAVFALAGTLVMLAPKLQVFVFPIPVPRPLWVAVIGGFLILSFVPGIAWQAHLGGLVFGLVAGYLITRRGRYYYY